MDSTAERQEQLITRLVEWIRDKDLRVPAIFFLQINKPLALIGSQALLFFQPLIGFLDPMWGWFADDQAIADWAAMLENPACLDDILSRLES